MNSPLTLIPAKVRLTIYLAYFLIALGFTSIGAYFQALHAQVPNWAIGGAAAIVPIGAAFAAVAASNTTRTPVGASDTSNSSAPSLDVPSDAATPVAPAADVPAPPAPGA